MRASPLPALFGLYLALGASPVRAQDPSVSEAQALFDLGKSLLAQGRYSEACPKLEASLQKVKAGGTALNLARCRMLEGKLASAWQTYQLASSLARQAGRPDREREALLRLKEIEPHIPQLTVVPPPQPPPGLSISIDGEILVAERWATPLLFDGGRHLIEARAPGYEPASSTVVLEPRDGRATVQLPALTSRLRVLFTFSRTPPQGSRFLCDGTAFDSGVPTAAVVMRPGEHHCELHTAEGDSKVDFVLSPSEEVLTVPVPVAAPPVPVLSAAPALSTGRVEPKPLPAQPSGVRHPLLAVGVSAFSLVSLAVGTGYALDASSKRDEVEARCPDLARCAQGEALNDEAGRHADYATVAVGLGLAGMGVATYLWVFDRYPNTQPKGVALSPLGGPGYAGIKLVGALP